MRMKYYIQSVALAITLLHCELSKEEFDQISMCSTAKEIWDKLEITYEGTSRVKETKINFLVTQYEMFRMEKSKSIA